MYIKIFSVLVNFLESYIDDKDMGFFFPFNHCMLVLYKLRISFFLSCQHLFLSLFHFHYLFIGEDFNIEDNFWGPHWMSEKKKLRK